MEVGDNGLSHLHVIAIETLNFAASVALLTTAQHLHMLPLIVNTVI
jgi:hypothetical protein